MIEKLPEALEPKYYVIKKLNEVIDVVNEIDRRHAKGVLPDSTYFENHGLPWPPLKE